MTSTDFEIVEVVRRRDLHGPSPLFRIGIIIANDRNPSPDQRQDCVSADQVLEELIIRMYGNRNVPEHGLWTRGGNNDEIIAVLQRIFDVPKTALGLDLHDFEIGNGGLELGVPIDQPLVLVDEAFAVKR